MAIRPIDSQVKGVLEALPAAEAATDEALVRVEQANAERVEQRLGNARLQLVAKLPDHIHHEFLWQWLLGIRPDRLLLTEGELVQLIQHQPLGLWVQLTLMLLAVLGASGLEDTKEEPRCETAVVDARVLVELDSSEPLRGECPLERS